MSTMSTEDIYLLAEGMEADGCVHSMMLAWMLEVISPYFGANLITEVNARRFQWDEIILALYLFVEAAPDLDLPHSQFNQTEKP